MPSGAGSLRTAASVSRAASESGSAEVVTTRPETSPVLPRTVTIRDGRIGGEGRSGDEYAVVTADGFLPLLGHVRDKLPPGTLVRIDEVGDHFELKAEER